MTTHAATVRAMNLLLRIALTLLAAAVSWGLMVRAFGGWDIDACLTQVYSNPSTAPSSC